MRLIIISFFLNRIFINSNYGKYYESFEDVKETYHSTNEGCYWYLFRRILSWIGQSDMTSDATFDLAYRQFADVEKNLSTLHTQCVNLVRNGHMV